MGRRLRTGFGCVAVAAVVAVLVAGCSSSSRAATTPVSSVAPTTTTPTVPGQAPSAGCVGSAAKPAAGDIAHRITVGGVVHPYLLSVPADYEPARPAPLVLLFHGFGSNGHEFARLTNMPARGAARGTVVVTPDGPNNTWQLDPHGTDAAFVDAIVASVSKSLCIDTHRVYAAGFSQGAAFALLYSCARPDRIAAIATDAVDFLLGCRQPVPILSFHGTADPLVPYQNGAVGLSLPGQKVRGTLLNMSDWARLDHCAPTASTHRVGSEVVRSSWGHCAAGTEVELYTIEGGGHVWPGADPKASPLQHTTQQISATTLTLDFFARHHLP